MIPYNFYYWGPLLTRTELSDDIIKMLAEKGDELTIEEHDHSKHLVGEIEEEKKYPEDFTRQISKLLRPHVDNYFDVLKNQWNPTYKDIKTVYKLQSMWINYQRKGESNPIHQHDCDISFVIYVDIPQEIIDEEPRHGAHNLPPGCIVFDHAQSMNHLDDDIFRKALSPINHFVHQPKTGEMFIFPSTLRHYVLPFYSDVVRKSISGNYRLRRL